MARAAAEIASALGLRYRSRDWWRCRCPVHQPNSATLALRDGIRGLIVHCHAGCSRDDIFAELQRTGLLRNNDLTTAAPPNPIEQEQQEQREACDRERRIAEAIDLWRHQTIPPAGTAVERYWYERLPVDWPIPPTIRASRGWFRHPSGSSRPAMVALVQHVEHGSVAIHRTWLQIDGLAKASFNEPKMSLGPVKGGAVRLARAGETLLVGEGIETSAAGMVATGLPAWAALSAPGMEALILPPLPIAAMVIILADNDANGAGQRAARNAARRWLAEGRRVRIAMPPEPGTDWADVLATKGQVCHAA